MIASIMMAFTSYLRTLASDMPYSSFFVLALSYLIVAGGILTVLKIRMKNNFQMPWYKEVAVSEVDDDIKGEKIKKEMRFSKLHMLLVFVGGMCEFGISLTCILAFGLAGDYEINAGIAGIFMPLSSVIVGLASFFFYKEKMQITGIVGMFVIIGGATLIAMFPAVNDSGDVATTSQILFVLSLSLLATVFLSVEIMVSKTLAIRGADGRLVGFSFLFVMGIVGSLCLAISTIAGQGLMVISMADFWYMMAGGVCGVTAISLFQYSISQGSAGIASAIFNTNSAFFTALCFFLLDQALSNWQITGIVITLLGACFMSINDEVFPCCKDKKNSAQSPEAMDKN